MWSASSDISPDPGVVMVTFLGPGSFTASGVLLVSSGFFSKRAFS